MREHRKSSDARIHVHDHAVKLEIFQKMDIAQELEQFWVSATAHSQANYFSAFYCTMLPY